MALYKDAGDRPGEGRNETERGIRRPLRLGKNLEKLVIYGEKPGKMGDLWDFRGI